MIHTHDDLVKIAHRWVLKNGSCGVAFKELTTGSSNEIPDVIGFGAWKHSVLVECKVSRSDFLSDRKKPFRINPSLGMGLLRYYCCPTGLIKPEELPEGWGLIYVNEKGKARLVYAPNIPNLEYPTTSFAYRHERNIEAEMGVMYSALRRLHLRGSIESIYDNPYADPNSPATEKRSVATDVQSNSLFSPQNSNT